MRFVAEPADSGARLDHLLTRRMPETSRARLQQWIEAGRVLVNALPRKASHRLQAGDAIDVEPSEAPPLQAFPEEIPIDVLYEDASVIAINKPAGMVVHSGAGRHAGTLVNALLHRFSSLSSVGGGLRPGIVHRIDKGTSGVLLVAKSDAAHRALAGQFASRKVEKLYIALVQGNLKRETGTIDRLIARDPVHRTRMTARAETGRTAHTEYRLLERFARYDLLEVRIGTGRTHQIRVHLASLGHPVAGDTLYGATAASYGRPFLHAFRITFQSPDSGVPVTVEAPLPAELEDWLTVIRSASLKEGSLS